MSGPERAAATGEKFGDRAPAAAGAISNMELQMQKHLITPGGAGNPPSMSSLEIAELTGKRHDNVMRDIRVMLEGLGVGILSFEGTQLNHQNGQSYPIFRLPKRETLILVSGYSVELRAKIIDRLAELEAAQAITMPNFADPVAAARAWADQHEARQLAERTKAEIGSRREATAMNTASQAVKKVARLEIELDQSQQYATVKRMEMLYHGQRFDWRLLKRTAIEMGMPPKDIFDANYGKVNAYPAAVWMEAYALEIPGVSHDQSGD